MPKRYSFKATHADGTTTYSLSSWGEFEDYIRERMLDFRHFVWRGQASSAWALEPTLDRILKKIGKINDPNVRDDHLKAFEYATRGRRGPNPRTLQDQNEWWALGQHHGLATPLLDWSKSPFVAAYFAFISEGNESSENRAVFGLSQFTVQLSSAEILKNWEGTSRPPIIEFVEPLSDENDRLVSQGGLFTRSPDGQDIETWVREKFKGDTYSRLVKLLIPNSERSVCLRSLNRMNINHLTLFPDLYGASKFCNLDLFIEKY